MTTHTDLHPLAQGYVSRLADAARVLDPVQAAELVTDISDHLHEALLPGASEAEVRTVLDRLGTPQELVVAAGGPEATATPATKGGLGAVEILALVGFVAAELVCFIFPLAVLLWIAAIALLAVSRVWSGREKALGAVALATGLPVFFAGVFMTLSVSAGTSGSCSSESVVTTTDATRPVADSSYTCDPLGPTTTGWVAYAVLALFVAYLCFQVWTLWRLTRRR